jgi:membrane-bound inhibitor of C-type lysozyme
MNRIFRPMLLCAALVLAGCGGLDVSKMWPFDSSSKEQDLSRTPPGATAYQCEGGKRLFVRYLDNGGAAWVILPDREFRLTKGGAGYTNGNATLEAKGGDVALYEGTTVTHAGCKPTGR